MTNSVNPYITPTPGPTTGYGLSFIWSSLYYATGDTVVLTISGAPVGSQFVISNNIFTDPTYNSGIVEFAPVTITANSNGVATFSRVVDWNGNNYVEELQIECTNSTILPIGNTQYGYNSAYIAPTTSPTITVSTTTTATTTPILTPTPTVSSSSIVTLPYADSAIQWIYEGYDPTMWEQATGVVLNRVPRELHANCLAMAAVVVALQSGIAVSPTVTTTPSVSPVQ